MFILVLFTSFNNTLIHFNHIEASQSICNANKLTAFYMIWVFTKSYSQIDCSILLKILYLAQGSSKEFCTSMGFFVPRPNLPFTTLCDIVKVRYIFWGFSFSTQSVDSRIYSYKDVDNKSQNYMQSNNIIWNIWCLLSFPLQTLLKLFLLLIVTYTIKHFKFFTKIYHCFALFHRKK